MSDFSKHFHELRSSVVEGNIDELENQFKTHLEKFPHMVDFQDNDRRTLLIYALIAGQKKVVSYLMYEQGADVDTIDKFNKDALDYEREWNERNPLKKISYVEQEIAERSSMSEGSIPRSSMSSLTDRNIYPRSRSSSMSEYSVASTLSDMSIGGSKKRKTKVKTQKRKRYNKNKKIQTKRRRFNKRRKIVRYY
jgi:hypothetical protein